MHVLAAPIETRVSHGPAIYLHCFGLKYVHAHGPLNSWGITTEVERACGGGDGKDSATVQARYIYSSIPVTFSKPLRTEQMLFRCTMII